jgi:hypothetical protein
MAHVYHPAEQAYNHLLGGADYVEHAPVVLPGSSASSTTGVVLCPIICFLLLVDGLPYNLKVTALERKRIGQRTTFHLGL